MADVKWIKIVTDIFSDEKMLLIDGQAKRDSIIVIWFKLLCLAGKQNNGGVFTIGNKTPYTVEMLATSFHRPLNVVRLALKTFEQYGMIEIVDGTIIIPNWEKHQTLDAYEKKKQRDRIYQENLREKQRALLKNRLMSDDSSSKIVITDKEEDIEKNSSPIGDEQEKAAEKIPIEQIRILWNDTAVSYSKANGVNGNRRILLVARWKEHPDLNWWKEYFARIESSAFLKGKNDRGWKATFDWVLDAGNMDKILEGKYDDSQHVSDMASYDLGLVEQMLKTGE